MGRLGKSAYERSIRRHLWLPSLVPWERGVTGGRLLGACRKPCCGTYRSHICPSHKQKKSLDSWNEPCDRWWENRERERSGRSLQSQEASEHENAEMQAASVPDIRPQGKRWETIQTRVHVTPAIRRAPKPGVARPSPRASGRSTERSIATLSIWDHIIMGRQLNRRTGFWAGTESTVPAGRVSRQLCSLPAWYEGRRYPPGPSARHDLSSLPCALCVAA